MNVKIVTDDKLLEKIDKVKNHLGIDVNNYSTAIGLICDATLDDLELKEKYMEVMEKLFNLLMNSNSESFIMTSEVLKEGMMVYKNIIG